MPTASTGSSAASRRPSSPRWSPTSICGCGDDLGDDSLRRVLDLRLVGYTRQEIARRLGCAVRTVGRKLELIRMALVGGES